MLADLKGKSVVRLNREQGKELRFLSAIRRSQADPATAKSDLLANVYRLLAFPVEIPAAQCRELGTVKRDGYTITKLAFETEPGITVPALAFSAHEASSPRGPTVIYLHGDGKSADAAPGGPIEELSRSGFSVLALDIRGMGETAPGKPASGGRNYFGVDSKEAFLSLHLARPLLGQRVLDVLSILKSSPETSSHGYHIIGVGSSGPIALHAAALDDRIKRVELRQSVVSWSAVVESPISVNQLSSVIPSALATYDLPDLTTLIAPRALVVRE